jgi:DNA-binding NtrC family response regulator
MKILILEDRQEAIDHFAKNISKGHEVHYAKTSTDAIWKLSNEKFDIVFLDHDVPNTHEHNGLEVAMFLAMRLVVHIHDGAGSSPLARVIIHSRNKYGSQAMKQILPDALCWPGIQEFPEQLTNIINYVKERYDARK